MNREDLAEKFKDADDPLRLVFVCAMWMTGFDAPSVSTIYLDRPMQNHTLMQTIARANRVFPEKDNGLIVDYIGVFRNLEKALAIYGAASGRRRLAHRDHRRPRRANSMPPSAELIAFCSSARRRSDRAARRPGLRPHRACATPPSRRCSSTRRPATSSCRRPGRSASCSRRCCPNPQAAAQQRTVAAIRVLAERIAEVTRPPAGRHLRRRRRRRRAARPLGRRRGVRHPRRRRGQRTRPAHRPVADRLRRPRREVRRPQAGRDRPARRSCCRQQAIGAAPRNPTRYELVERIEQLIADYNAGSVNIDEYLRRLIELSADAHRRGRARRRARA